MDLKRLMHIVARIGIAAGVTAGVYYLNTARAQRQSQEEALRWARQVAAQAEGMVLVGKQNGNLDPISWAAGFLTQGSEPRAVRVSKIEVKPGQNSETLSFDQKTGSLEYARVFSPEDGSGVKIQLSVGYSGFLGAKSKVVNDLFAFSVFSFLCFFIFVVSHLQRPKRLDDSELRNSILTWLSGAKGLLTQLGIHIREMVREAQNLAVASAQSRNTMASLRDRIHSEIRELRDSKKLFQEVENLAVQAEVNALNLLIRNSRVSSSDDEFSMKTEDIHRILQKIRKLNQKNQSKMNHVEVQLEPWATDADIAFQTYADVLKATQGMDGHIRKTTETLLGHATLIKNLRGKVENADEPPLTKEPAQSENQVFTSTASKKAPFKRRRLRALSRWR